MSKFVLTTKQLMDRLGSGVVRTAQDYQALQQFVDALDAGDGVKDGFVFTIWQIDTQQATRRTPDPALRHEALIEAKGAALLKQMAPDKRAAIVRRARQFSPTPDYQEVRKDLKGIAEATGKRSAPIGSFSLHPGRMREQILDLKREVATKRRQTSPHEMGIDTTTALGRRTLDLLDVYYQSGLEGLLRAISQWNQDELKQTIEGICKNYPVRINFRYDAHLIRRVFLSVLLNDLGRFAHEADERKRWLYQPKPETAEINEQSRLARYREWVDKNILGEAEVDLAQTLFASDLYTGHRGENERIRERFYDVSPITLALLIEGVARAMEVTPKVAFTRAETDAAETALVWYRDAAGGSQLLRVQQSDGIALTSEGRAWLGKILSAVHQILPPGYALHEAMTSPMPGPQIVMQRKINFPQRPITEINVLRIGKTGAFQIEELLAYYIHELGHYIDNMLIRRDCGAAFIPGGMRDCRTSDLDGMDWPWNANAWARKELLYAMALRADAGLIFADFLYSDGPVGDGHPHDNDQEFFASAFQAYVLHADELARNITDPATPPSVRDYAAKMWCFLRDEIFHGTVFTTNGRDPFRGHP